MPRESRWKPDWKHLICISSSKFRPWPWSEANSESEAERLFADAYPVISNYLFQYKNKLKDRNANNQGKFYWEIPRQVPTRDQYPRLSQPKIIYPADGLSLGAGYDKSESFILGNWTIFIPTADFSLLAILNSTLFDWYAKANYQAKYKSNTRKNWLTFKKANMKNFPVSHRTERQKTELSQIVSQILDVPDSPEVPALEEEINMLVYDLYDLTSAEIALIEEQSNP